MFARSRKQYEQNNFVQYLLTLAKADIVYNRIEFYNIGTAKLPGGTIFWLIDQFAAVRMSETNEDCDHQHQDVRKENGKQYGDLLESMDFEYLRKNTGVNLAAMANLAWAPGAPKKVGVLTTELTNKTDLQWEAPSKGKSPAGYYVLMRETNSSNWERKFFVKDTKASLNYSKDNYFFAI